MFGLTLEKLFVVAIIAAIVIGPSRLPRYAAMLGGSIRSLRAFVETTRTRAEAETGVPLSREQWEALDLRRYDPRAIIREALDGEGSLGPVTGLPEPAARWTDDEIARIRPGQRFVVSGDSAHPRRIAIDDLPDDDPVRLAARPVDADQSAA